MLNKLYSKFRKSKLTTRLTIANLLMFLSLLALVYFLVTLLTKQFIFMKNRDELLDKQKQIQEYLDSQKTLIENRTTKEKIETICILLDKIQLFDSSQFILLINDDSTLNSFNYKPTYYKERLGNFIPFELKHLTFTTSYGEKLIGETFPHSFLEYHVTHSFDGDEYQSLFKGTIPLAKVSDPQAIQSVKISKEQLWFSSTKINFNDDYIYINLFLTPQLDFSFLASLRTALFLGGLISIAIIFFFGKALTKRALRPLVDLSYISQSIDNEKLSYRIPTNGSNDEVDTLIKSLNLMLDNLEKSFSSQQRFVSDASHELRIPLTIIIGYIDLLKNIGMDDPNLLKESIEAIEEEATNMNRLVERLLLIARLENNRLSSNFESIEIVPFIKKRKYENQQIYKDRTIQYSATYRGTLYADRELVKQILRALTENAIKYAPDSPIHIKCYEEGEYVVLSVVDFGPGIPHSEIPNLTNRFYRVASDRNRLTGGTGLGLSIVQALMKIHHGHLTIESIPNRGTAMNCYFPKV